MTSETIGDLENEIGNVIAEIEEYEDRARVLYEQHTELEQKLIAAKRVNQEEAQQIEVIDIE